MEYNELTAPFVEGYVKRFGETPTYTAGTYSVIVSHLVRAIEKTGTLDADKLVAFMEEDSVLTTAGKDAYLKDEKGRQLRAGITEK